MDKSFNTSFLKKIREKILSAMKHGGFEYPKHFSLSPVNQVGATFNISLNTKSESEMGSKKRITEAQQSILKELPLVEFSRIGGDCAFRVDVQYEYYQMSEAAGVPKQTSVVEVKPLEEKTTGDHSTTRHTFLKSIQDLITDKFYVGRKFGGKVIKHNGDKDVALLSVSKELFYQVIDYLMKYEDLKLVPTINSQIIIYRDTNPNGAEANRYVRFKQDYTTATELLMELENLVRQSIIYLRDGHGGDPIFTCNTYASELAWHNNEFRCHFTITDQVLGNGVAGIFSELSIPAEKVGQAVYVTATKNLTTVDIQKRWLAFTQRGKVRKQGFVVTTGENGQGGLVTHVSYDYDQFHFLPFNRPPVKTHIQDLREYINEFGFLDWVIVARTDVVDGEVKDWIVDRQHRFLALKMDKRPIPYAIIHVHSKAELIRLVAVLNSSARKWTAQDYLNAWSSMQMEEYRIIKEWRGRLQITPILQAMTGLDRTNLREKFQKGNLSFPNMERGRQILEELVQLKDRLPRGVRYTSAAAKFLFRMHQKGPFVIERLIDGITRGLLEFSVDDRDPQIIQKLENVYATTA